VPESLRPLLQLKATSTRRWLVSGQNLTNAIAPGTARALSSPPVDARLDDMAGAGADHWPPPDPTWVFFAR